MDLGLQDKLALVTGSYRGTGRGIAFALAREGARVLVHGFEADQPEPVVEAIRAEGHRAEAVVGDITSESGSEALIDRVEALGGAVDVLVNNYGVPAGGDWLGTPDAAWLDVYQRNVLSGVRLVRAFAPGMRERGFGRIIWLGTVGSTRPGDRMPHYYASKATLPNLCVSLAKELAGSGVTVNVVSPGIIATDEVKAGILERAARKGWGSDWEAVQRQAIAGMFPNPTGRLAEVDEVASLVAFVASERAGYINGANLRIDGGASDCAL